MNGRRKMLSGLSLILALGVSACSEPVPELRIPADSPVMEDAAACVAIGPRYAGSPGAEKTAEWIRSRIRPEPGWTLSVDEFTDRTPAGEKVFRNVILDIPGAKKDFLIVGTHYDTKYFPGSVRFDGANDGASGTAALLAMIRALSGVRLPMGVRFLFFDGEEALHSYSEIDGLHGSRRAAARLVADGEVSRCRAMILLDMIGDRGLDIGVPSDTPDGLYRIAAEAARRIGAGSVLFRSRSVMVDDHVPFRDLGIPSIDLIDFHYGPANAFWHTPEDTLDKISAESIRTAAGLALEMIRILMTEGGKLP